MDLTCSVAQTPGKVIMEPNEFCLPVNEKQDVAIIIQLSDKDLSCWEKSPASFVTVLSFYYGDEISRQLYQRLVLPMITTDSSIMNECC